MPSKNQDFLGAYDRRHIHGLCSAVGNAVRQPVFVVLRKSPVATKHDIVDLGRIQEAQRGLAVAVRKINVIRAGVIGESKGKVHNSNMICLSAPDPHTDILFDAIGGSAIRERSTGSNTLDRV